MKKSAMLCALILALAGCNTPPIVEMGRTEYGVRFRMLPPLLGGGVSPRIINKGQVSLVWPWDRIYRFDTRVQSLEWGARGAGSQPGREDFVWTRALDGNEVALAVKVEYQISEKPEELVRLVREIATSNQQVAEIVTAVARADIRTYMNQLKTSEFFKEKFKYAGQDKVRDAMRERLGKLGIMVTRVNLGEHRFGDEYQEMINQIQTQDEQTNRENLRVQTVIRDKERELNEMQARVNRVLKEAEAFQQQAKLRGDSYFESRKNQAQAIRAKGEAEVEGMVKQILALAGPGGKAILKLELVKQLLKNGPRFAVTGEGGEGLNVKRTDTNTLLEQIGVFEGLESKRDSGGVPAGQRKSPPANMAGSAAR